MAKRVTRRAHTRINPATGRPVQVRAHSVTTKTPSPTPDTVTGVGLNGPDSWLLDDPRLEREFLEPDSPYRTVRFQEDTWEATVTAADGTESTVALSPAEWEILVSVPEIEAARFLVTTEHERALCVAENRPIRYWVGTDEILWMSRYRDGASEEVMVWNRYSQTPFFGSCSDANWARIQSGDNVVDLVEWVTDSGRCICGAGSQVGVAHNCEETDRVTLNSLSSGFRRAELSGDRLVIERGTGDVFELTGASTQDAADLWVGGNLTWARWQAEQRLTRLSRSGVAQPALDLDEFGSGTTPVALSFVRPSTVRALAQDNPGERFSLQAMAWIPSEVDDLNAPLRNEPFEGQVRVQVDRYGRPIVDPTEVTFGAVTATGVGVGPRDPKVSTVLATALSEIYTHPRRVANRRVRDHIDRYVRHNDRVQACLDRCLQNRARAAERFRPETVYAENLDRFQEAYRRARDRRANGEEVVGFVYDDATDGVLTRETGRGFGLEIEYEFDGLDDPADIESRNAQVAASLYEAGLIPNPSQSEYHSGREGEQMWAFERDDTVHGEVISPVMFDDRKSWEDLEAVCRILRSHGASITTNCGGHIHVGVGDFDHDPTIHARLIGEYQNNEDFLFRVGADPVTGNHRGIDWCNPVWECPSGYDRVSDMGQVFHNHASALNFAEVSGSGEDHVEFRFFDGSLDPAVIQTRVRLAGAMAEAAMADRGTDGLVPERVGHRASRAFGEGPLRGEAWRASLRRPAAFLDSLFRRDSDKDSVIALWAINRNPDPNQPNEAYRPPRQSS